MYNQVLTLSQNLDECKPLVGGHAAAARAAGGDGPHGRAVQVDPIKPTLKAPGTKRFETKI